MAHASRIVAAMDAQRGLLGVADSGLSLLGILSKSARELVRVLQVLQASDCGQGCVSLLKDRCVHVADGVCACVVVPLDCERRYH
jgi:hypothetical protein